LKCPCPPFRWDAKRPIRKVILQSLALKALHAYLGEPRFTLEVV
jgi:hypothetical protein